MHRTISFNFPQPEGWENYLKTCNQMVNLYIAWSKSSGSTSPMKAHKDLYQKFRKEFSEIPSAVVQSLRDQALSLAKRWKNKSPIKKPLSSLSYNACAVDLKGCRLSIAWSGKRLVYQIDLPKFFRERYVGWKLQSATVGLNSKKKCLQINLVFKSPQDPDKLTENKVLGLDRGIHHLVTTSEGEKFSSAALRKIKRKYQYLRSKLQTKGTPSAKRRLRALSGKEHRFSSQVNHLISKKIVNSEFDTFVFEDLKGIRKQRKGKKLNTWLSNWSFFQLETFLEYKAFAKGKSVYKIDPAYTSQTCSNCGAVRKENRIKSKYHCSSCGFRCHADINAAINIKNKYLAVAKQPAQIIPIIPIILKESTGQVVCQSTKRQTSQEILISLRSPGEGN